MKNYDTISTILDLVAKANPKRHKTNLNRRVHKLLEEAGEVSEAYLNITSSTNHKKKSWSDVQEEACDVLIVAVDVGLTSIDDNDQDMLRQRFDDYVRQWLHNINIGYDSIVWRVVGLAARFGEKYVAEPDSAHHYSADMIRYSFALVDLVFKGDDAAIIAQVTKKLAKWTKNRVEKIVATDCE